MKKIILFLGQLLLIAFLAFLARECWRGFLQERENEVFSVEGKPVTVQVEKIISDKRDWKDYLGFSKYIGFTYRGKSYDLRYLPDSGWVGEGTRVGLLYSATRDRFLQPSRLRHPEPNVKSSRLIHWTVAGSISYAHFALLAFIVLSAILALFIFSILFNLIGWTLFDFLARIVKIVLGFGLLTYFTWNVISNYNYYNQIANGGSKPVLITETQKRSAFQTRKSNDIHFYYYTALTPDSTTNRQRRIMISSSDYDRLHKGDLLTVRYQSAMDEMMSVNYSFEYYKWVFLGMIWVIALYLIFHGLKTKKS